ncbi:MAG TPA: restriction endonuclease subunit S, partial [Thermodesulfobacteriota bacterium]|nr:restriction endonuclease subunit S [Thermodesulfobacteriota bacterium]
NEADLMLYVTGVTVPKLNQEKLRSIPIPLPPLEVQKEIVSEIEGYQKIIDGARAVIDNYRPHIAIDPEWPMVEIGDIYLIEYGIAESIPENLDPEGIRIISTAEAKIDGTLDLSKIRRIKKRPSYDKFILERDTLLFNWRNAPKHVGKTVIFNESDGDYVYASFLLSLTKKIPKVENRFVCVILNQLREAGYFMRMSRQAVNQTNFNATELAKTHIPLPSHEIQRAIVAEIEAEQALVNNNRELIERMEKKIQAVLARIWGEG